MIEPRVGDGRRQERAAETAGKAGQARARRPGDEPAARPEGNGAQSEALWDVQQVAHYLRMRTSSVYKMTARSAGVRIPHIHIGNKLRFRQTDIDRWLELLTVSNLDTLARMRERSIKVTHGHD